MRAGHACIGAIVVALATVDADGSATAEALHVAPGSALVLDGVLSADEWATATTVENDGVELLMARHDGELQLGVRAPGMIVASLCVRRGDAVHVLHASAALGRAIYRSSKNGWVLEEPFEWAVRTMELTDQANAERRAYFDANGWVASTARMGTPGETEMRISGEYLDAGGTRVALGVMIQDDEGVRVTGVPLGPDGDASTMRALIGGPPPAVAIFDVDRWIVLRVSDG